MSTEKNYKVQKNEQNPRKTNQVEERRGFFKKLGLVTAALTMPKDGNLNAKAAEINKIVEESEPIFDLHSRGLVSDETLYGIACSGHIPCCSG